MSDVATQRKTRSDKGSIAFTARDVWALTWIAQQFGIRVDMLPALLARKAGKDLKEAGRLAETTTRALIERWIRAGWVERRKVLAGEPAWVFLSRRGLQSLGVEYRYWEPSAAGVTHYQAINKVRMRLEEKNPNASWKSERELLVAREQAEAEARAGGRPPPKQHTPDAEVIDTHRIAVEVELTPKTRDRTVGIIRGLLGRYDEVWYFTAPQARSAVEAAYGLLDTQAQQQLKIYRLETLG